MKSRMRTKKKVYLGLLRALMYLAAGLTAALVLFLFIMLINATLNFLLKRDKSNG